MDLKFACITGASRGIGLEIARVLAGKGYYLGLISKNSDKLQRASNELSEEFPAIKIYHQAADVSKPDAINNAIDFFYEKHPRIDVLVNNAGIFHRGTVDISFDDYMEMTMINQFGAFNVLKKVVPVMKEQRHGYIFNLSSMSGIRALPEFGGYASTKFALRALSESLTTELEPFGIKVTAICPGQVITDMTLHSKLPDEKKIKTSDIGKLITCLLDLSRSVQVKNIALQHRTI